MQGVFIDHGVAAKYSVAVYNNGVFWLSRNRQGQGVVLTSAGYRTERISTYAIEEALRTYTRIDDAIGCCYQIPPTFYVLTFPAADHTWCYDVGTKFWHEWGWIDTNGDEHRHRANCSATFDRPSDRGRLARWQHLRAQQRCIYRRAGGEHRADQAGAEFPAYCRRWAPGLFTEIRRWTWTGRRRNSGSWFDQPAVSLRWTMTGRYGNPVTQAIGGRSAWARAVITRLAAIPAARTWRATRVFRGLMVNPPTRPSRAPGSRPRPPTDEPVQQQAAE